MAATSHARFAYGPLKNPTNEIRLLKQMQPQSKNGNVQEDQIRCELHTWRMIDCPKYIAMSYTWGDSSNPETILVNGAPMSIRQNCRYVLWQARRQPITEYLWIDAICINQEDDDEKSQQVSMMGSIYRNASQVNICLGPHGGDSELFFQFAHQHARYSNVTLQQAKTSGQLAEVLKPLEAQGLVTGVVAEKGSLVTSAMFSPRVRGILREQLKTMAFFETVAQEEIPKLVMAIHTLSARNYFTRLWIIQEILLAREVIVYCGESSIPYPDVLDCMSDLVVYCSDARLEDRPYDHSDQLTLSKGFSNIQNVWHYWPTEGMSLVSLIDYFAESQCAETRDRIYGVLALVDWQGLLPLVPDYKKSTYEIALQIISYMRPLDDGNMNAVSSYEQRPFNGNENWPIVSTHRIAVALDLTAQSPDVQNLLEKRRTRNDSSNIELPNNRPLSPRMHVIIEADYYCQLFKPADGDANSLSACLIQRESGLQLFGEGTMGPDWAVELDTSELDSIPFRNIHNGNGPQARVSADAQEGDYILSFHMSAVNAGLVIREVSNNPGEFSIIGQALFDENTRPCPGEESCSCMLDPEMHPNDQKKMVVHFEPEDLLLFVCHSLIREEEREALALGPWEDEEVRSPTRSYASAEGDFFVDDKLEYLRLVTPVVQCQNHLSSFATMAEHGDPKEVPDEGRTAEHEALRDFVQRFEAKRSKHPTHT